MTISAVAFDVFGTLCYGESSAGLLSWLDGLPRLERQHIIDEWMCGRFGYDDLLEYGDMELAPSAPALKSKVEAVAATT